MVWMQAVFWIVVQACVGKRVAVISGAACAAVDVKAENLILTVACRSRKSEQFRRDKHTCSCLIEADSAGNIRVCAVAMHNGGSIRGQLGDCGKIRGNAVLSHGRFL